MTRPTMQETRRLFGPINRPDYTKNVRHRAILRKALELFTPAELAAVFRSPTRLTVVMGLGYASDQLGKIRVNYSRRSPLTNHQTQNGNLVSHETDAPGVQARRALEAYRDGYDAYFKKQGHEYVVKDAQARHILQAAEQAWHDWIVPYLAARGGRTRPNWALQPLPGLRPVRVAPVLAPLAPAPVQAPLPTLPPWALPPVPAPQPVHVAPAPVQAPLPTLPPWALPPRPALQPVRVPAPAPPATPVRVRAAPAANLSLGSRLYPIDLSHDEVVGDVRTPKRRFLGVVDISDDEEASRPRKKQRLWRVVDLTN
ncbi:hypothetical protein B0H12DRAFT_1082975 [Mycena haematopus]|nr:hypothetical protein B0H12DRAFT_1082975 [Mycena haematopus]